MPAGVDAARGYVESEFKTSVQMSTHPEGFFPVLSFQSEGRSFSVNISTEFDQDCDAGAIDGYRFLIEHDLAGKLRSSKNGKAAVRTGGIAPL
jgi:hypothetical protein